MSLLVNLSQTRPLVLRFPALIGILAGGIFLFNALAAPEPVEIVLGASSETHSEVLSSELQIGDLIILNPPTVFEQDGPPPFVQQR